MECEQQHTTWFAFGDSDSPEIRIESVGKFSKKTAIDEQKLCRIVRLVLFEGYTLRDTADTLGVSHMTVYRALQKTTMQLGDSHRKLYERLYGDLEVLG